MLLEGYRKTLGAAMAGTAPLNGMYAFYASAGVTPPTINSTTTLAAISAAYAAKAGGGAARISATTQMPTSGGVLFMGSTANANITIDATKKIYGFSLVALSADSSGDEALDYNTVNGGLVVPANGCVTLMDKITC